MKWAVVSSRKHIESCESRTMLSLYGPDVSFGNGGQVAAGGGALIAPLSDGKILAVARREVPTDPRDTDPDVQFDCIVSRINADGTLDTTFGGSGKINLGVADHIAWSGTRLYVLNSGDFSSTVSAFTGDGVSDTTFGNNGSETVPFHIPAADASNGAVAFNVLPTPDGGALIQEQIFVRHGKTSSVIPELAEIKADGSLNTSFGNGGFAEPGSILQDAVVQLTQNGILLSTETDLTHTRVTRYKLDGSGVDTSFGAITLTTLPQDIFEEPGGKLLYIGTGSVGGKNVRQLSRLTVDGSPDTSFGTSGSVPLADPNGDSVRFEALAFDAQNRIVVEGSGRLFRFNSTGVLDSTPPFNGSVVVNGLTRADHITFDSQGRLLAAFQTRIMRFDTLAPIVLGNDQVVHITGDATNDQVFIQPISGKRYQVSLNGAIKDFPRASVVGFNLFLDEGNNSATSTVDLPTTVFTGSGADSITTAGGDDSIDSGAGDDVISSGDGNDMISAGAGNDSIIAGAGNDLVDAGDDNDTVNAGNGDDTVHGDGGNDSIKGGDGNDILFGDAGKDRLYGGGGNDKVDGNAGDDRVFGGGGIDTLLGGDGNDVVMP